MKLLRWLANIPQDKLLHFFYASILTKALIQVLPLGWVFAIATAVFFSKEVYDLLSKKGTPEWKDLLFDYIGFLVGAL